MLSHSETTDPRDLKENKEATHEGIKRAHPCSKRLTCTKLHMLFHLLWKTVRSLKTEPVS